MKSGLDELWWPEAMMCFVFLKQVCDKLQSGCTDHFERYKADFEGPLIPFGAEVKYNPANVADKRRLPSFGNKNANRHCCRI